MSKAKGCPKCGDTKNGFQKVVFYRSYQSYPWDANDFDFREYTEHEFIDELKTVECLACFKKTRLSSLCMIDRE